MSDTLTRPAEHAAFAAHAKTWCQGIIEFFDGPEERSPDSCGSGPDLSAPNSEYGQACEPNIFQQVREILRVGYGRFSS